MASYDDSRMLIAMRLRIVRCERFGEDNDGVEDLARLLELPPETWRNYENGVVMPSEVLLNFIEMTGVSPHWLASGEGSQFAFKDSASHEMPENGS